MSVKITMRFQLSSNQNIIIKKINNSKFLQGCREWGTHILFTAAQLWTGASFMETSVEVKIKLESRNHHAK